MGRTITIQREAVGKFYVIDLEGVEVLGVFDTLEEAKAFAEMIKQELGNNDQ